MKKLKAFLVQHNLPHDAGRMEQYALYREEVLRRNEYINLTSVSDPLEFEEKHLLDSMTATLACGFAESKQVLDLGTGAGLPGIPLAISAPDKSFVLLDSVRKKLNQIDEMVEVLGLDNVETLHARAENAAHDADLRERFDLVVSRAVANLSTLSEYALPFVKKGGWFVAFKTAQAREEIEEAAWAIDVLGGSLKQCMEPLGGEHNYVLVCVEKIGATPNRFPRRSGIPARDPLASG